jgi:hypothetical protein
MHAEVLEGLKSIVKVYCSENAKEKRYEEVKYATVLAGLVATVKVLT